MQFADFQPLSPAETRLIETCSTAERITIDDGSLPTQETPETAVRADLLALILARSA